jgi:hypothetical protein
LFRGVYKDKHHFPLEKRMRKMTAILGLFVGGLGLAGIASGQFGGGFGGFGGAGGGRIDPLTLLNNPSVKKELDITDEQTQALPDAVMKALSGILSDKQLKRFKQIELQQRGMNAFADAKVQESLKLTEAQKDNVKTILEDSRKELAELAPKKGGGGGGGGFGKGNQEKRDSITKDTLEKITSVLSLDQKNTWKSMTGDSFKIEFGGFGGGGGFGNFKKKAAE